MGTEIVIEVETDTVPEPGETIGDTAGTEGLIGM